MLRYIVSVLLLSIIVGSCSLDPDILSFPDDVENKFEKVLTAILEKDTGFILSDFDPEQSSENLGDKLDNALSFLPEEQWQEFELIGKHINSFVGSGGSHTTYTQVFQVEYETRFAKIDIYLRARDGNLFIYGLHITQLQEDLSEVNAFSLSKPVHQLIYLVAMVGVFVFSLATFVSVIIRWKRLRSPGKWLVAVLIGVGDLSLNWTTGVYGFNFLSFGIFSAGFTSAGAYAPWLMSLYFPLGALLFWFRATPKSAVGSESSTD